ncbi:MAG: hypothetical protein JWN79_2733 [Gemmatimonadetes bacterium]|jgi:hypothetical protein|nr:hypothetical protein [Gemmatimonadota bacterium]
MRPPPFVPLLMSLALLGSTGAGAQNYSLNAHATVTSSVSVAQVASLGFGSAAIVPGTAITVSAANGGKARVDFNEPTVVTVPAFLLLAGPFGSQVRVDLACAQATTASASAPTLFSSGCAGGFTPPLGGHVGGSHYIYIGGALSSAASSAAPAGSFTGSFSVTASYVVY